MQDYKQKDSRSVLETLCVSLTMLAFGLGVLAYLIAIDRPEWFNLRPASGTATAMSNAARHVMNKEAQRKESANRGQVTKP